MHWTEIAALVLGIAFLIPILIFAGIILVMAWGMVVSRRRGPDPSIAQLEEAERAIRALSLEEAQAEAELILAANEGFRASPSPEELSPRLQDLGPTLREFFGRFPEVETPPGSLSGRDLALPEWAPGYVHLGQLDEHVHLLARPGEDAVHEIADDLPFAEALLVSYPSLFHWIVVEARKEELSHPH